MQVWSWEGLSDEKFHNSILNRERGVVCKKSLQQNCSEVFSVSTRGHTFLIFLFCWAGSNRKKRKEKCLKVGYKYFKSILDCTDTLSKWVRNGFGFQKQSSHGWSPNAHLLFTAVLLKWWDVIHSLTKFHSLGMKKANGKERCPKRQCGCCDGNIINLGYRKAWMWTLPSWFISYVTFE